MRYLLDTNAVIALLNDTTSPIARRIRRKAPREVGVSAVVCHELYYGAFKSQRVEKNVARVDALQFPVLEFDQEDARRPGEIRAHLRAPISPGRAIRHLVFLSEQNGRRLRCRRRRRTIRASLRV